MIKTIVKRDGREAEFDVVKISNAIYKAAEALVVLTIVWPMNLPSRLWIMLKIV